MKQIINTIVVMIVFSVGIFNTTSANADPIENIIVTGSYNGPTIINGMAWYDWANLQNNINYTGNYYTDAATVAAAAQAAIDAANAPPPTPPTAEETQACEQNADAAVANCQGTYATFNSNVGMVCASLLFKKSATNAGSATLCGSYLYYLQQQANQWCSSQGTALKNNTCY
jgi:hypothetical protein